MSDSIHLQDWGRSLDTNFEVDDQSTAGTITLRASGNLDVRNAVALKEALSSLTDESKPIVIDLNAVESLDTSTLQLLFAFSQTSAESISISARQDCPASQWMNIAGIRSHFRISDAVETACNEQPVTSSTTTSTLEEKQ